MVSSTGCIVLAAFQPDPELFSRQLRSLRDQSWSNWTCVISVDGDRAPVADLVKQAVEDDPRFMVIGDDRRRGFYLNFEHGLRHVPDDAEWVALCDQDDFWYPDKLERLVRLLDRAPMVSGQARLVAHPSGDTLGVTDRRYFGPDLTILANQFTGSICVFRTEILKTAIPFPVVPTKVATHDHWLAVVAGTYGTPVIVEDVVQDYVQHAENVYGDPSRQAKRTVKDSVAEMLGQARRFEGTASPIAVLRSFFLIYVGWRQVMTDQLRVRGRDITDEAVSSFGRKRRIHEIRRMLRRATEQGAVAPRFVIEYWISWFAGAVTGGRRRGQSLGSASR
jgi:glycosyltransferase involved in cell wall biosynthesis